MLKQDKNAAHTVSTSPTTEMHEPDHTITSSVDTDPAHYGTEKPDSDEDLVFKEIRSLKKKKSCSKRPFKSEPTIFRVITRPRLDSCMQDHKDIQPVPKRKVRSCVYNPHNSQSTRSATNDISSDMSSAQYFNYTNTEKFLINILGKDRIDSFQSTWHQRHDGSVKCPIKHGRQFRISLTKNALDKRSHKKSTKSRSLSQQRSNSHGLGLAVEQMEILKNSSSDMQSIISPPSKYRPSVSVPSKKSRLGCLTCARLGRKDPIQEILESSPSDDVSSKHSESSDDNFSDAKLLFEEPETMQEWVWQLFEEPASSSLGQIVAFWIMLLILISCTAFIIQTDTYYQGRSNQGFFWVEMFCTVQFTIEYILRFWASPNKTHFVFNAMNTIDLLAIVPVYVEWFGTSQGVDTSYLRVLRLARVFRVMKIGRYVSWIIIFINAIIASIQPLSMLLYVMMITIVFFSSFMYFLERGNWDENIGLYMRVNPATLEKEPSPFQSIASGFWWCMITMTTIGYGDANPVTIGGRIVSSFAGLCGVLVFAVPITVISKAFNNEIQHYQLNEKISLGRLMNVKELLYKEYRKLVEDKSPKTSIMEEENETDRFTLMTEVFEAMYDKCTDFDWGRMEGLTRQDILALLSCFVLNEITVSVEESGMHILEVIENVLSENRFAVQGKIRALLDEDDNEDDITMESPVNRAPRDTTYFIKEQFDRICQDPRVNISVENENEDTRTSEQTGRLSVVPEASQESKFSPSQSRTERISLIRKSLTTNLRQSLRTSLRGMNNNIVATILEEDLSRPQSSAERDSRPSLEDTDPEFDELLFRQVTD